AELVGSDANSDIAVIRIRRANLTVARLGEAKSLQVGELAVAIGSPFGFQHSVTAGVISALDRNVTVGHEADDRPKTYTHLIQTDAAINPGNSGGALINQKGEVVGINTLIYSTNGISQGIGFAIPVEEARKVATELINDGQVRYPFIGVEGQTVDQAIARKHRLKAPQGALVVEVQPESPAERAGLKVGDVITKFDDTKIISMDDLVAAVRSVGIDIVAKIQVNRDGNSQVLTIKTAKRPASF
ncbi:MAG TPA: PDZ domain-containing protein, partial [Actinobacteria bacterium]|nr:PDZ domain-containing protein [Actinomycetota bacterium]